MQSLVSRYPVGVSSDSLDWGWDSALEPSSVSGLRKPQVAGSIPVAGSRPRLRVPPPIQVLS